MELKPGYKQTEVGVIPDEWEVKPIKEFAAVKGGKRLPLGESLVDKETSHPYVRVTDMRPGGVLLSDIKYVPEDVFPTIKSYRISSKDIFISVAGTLGIVGKVPAELDGANLTENADKITNIDCDQDFLLHNLLSERIQAIIESERTVGVQPKLALGRIENFKIALPPTLPEQRAIAGTLADVDALLGALTQLIAKKRDLKQAAMQQLLTGQTRLPGFSGKWEVKQLGDVAEIVSGGTPRTGVASYWDGGIRWCTPTDITGTAGKYLSETARTISQAGLDSCSAQLLPAGALLLCSRATIGELKIAVRDVCTNQGFKSLIAKEGVSNEYLYYLLLTMKPQLVGRAIGSTFLEISKKDTASLDVSLPLFDEQSAIAAVLSDMDAELTALEQRLAKTRALKQGMMQELLTGRTRLV